MDFVKKNWEKILLGVILVGLLVAVGFLPLKIASEKQNLVEIRVGYETRTVAPIPPPDLSEAEKALERTRERVRLDLSSGHRLFNPVLWQKSIDGKPIKVQTGNEIGPQAVEVTEITPLYLHISLDSVLVTDSGPRYAIGIEKQAADRRRDRVKRQTYASVDDKNDTFQLREAKGPPEAPTSLELVLTDTGEPVAISAEKPFQRVDGYMTDLRYPPENRTWTDRRVGDQVPIAGEAYNIVAITKNEVVLSAQSGKKTSLKFNPSE